MSSSLVRSTLALALLAGCGSSGTNTPTPCGPAGECGPGTVCQADNLCRPPLDASSEGLLDATTVPDACGDPIAEQCNGLDDDCNGLFDDGELPLVGLPCGIEIGECTMGTVVCAPTPDCITRGDCVVCSGNVGSTAESCNNLDDDCDGETDNGFDFCNDPTNCGACGTTCLLDHTLYHATFVCAACEVPAPAFPCRIAACDDGYSECDGDDSNGCNCDCAGLPTPEICDGKDNDCEGLIDTADPKLLPPPICRQLGECAGATASCVTDARCASCSGQPDPETCWICQYGADVEISPSDPCRPASIETRCDDRDGNCNSLTDETFPQAGTPCDNGSTGACAVMGQFGCTADEMGTECDVSGDPGLPPSAELCNGVDDNCNGLTDENGDDAASATLGVRDSLVRIQRNALDFYIYRYEASRPGATDFLDGTLTHRACSSPNVRPWASIAWDDAAAACTAAGMRLCTQAEWDEACLGASVPDVGADYPYGEPYDPSACNGKDLDPVCPTGDDCAVATGSVSTCESDDQVFDLSGNVKEWTDDPEPDPPASSAGYRARGGSFDNLSGALACDFLSPAPPLGYVHENLGFRCCCTTGPGCPPP